MIADDTSDGIRSSAGTTDGRCAAGDDPRADTLLATLDSLPRETLLAQARALRDQGHGRTIGYSRKVFVPLTRLCRDVCAYCTFAAVPGEVPAAYLTPDQVLEIARAGAKLGCKEALFTLGDKPELRYRSAREALAARGHATTVDYVEEMCRLVLEETGLLPHVNAGVMTEDEIARLRRVSVSQGIMLESVSPRLFARGGPHYGSPDKDPAVRLEMIAAAGRQQVPFTSGILIGIGETRRDRIASLVALRDLHEQYGHLQEIIIQNFRAKPDTRMAAADEPDFDELMWTAAAARIVLGPDMHIQVPPNLSYERFPELLDAGIDDWGGVSPVTPDHVNPEAPWPQIERLARKTEDNEKILVERLAAYPSYVEDAARWIDPALHGAVMRHADSEGFARSDFWVVGADTIPPTLFRAAPPAHHTVELDRILDRAEVGTEPTEAEIVRLFAARGDEFDLVCRRADALREKVCGDQVSWVVTRNINYTNVCTYRCKFCAFSKGKTSENLRGKPYNLEIAEVQRRVDEAWHRGGTEVCLQGGIHPEYTGQTYLDICKAIRAVAPGMHIHAFSPLEIFQGAATLGLSLREFLIALKEAGLGSLPGTAAEILDDEVRAIICPDKLTTAQWLEVVGTAHEVGLRTTATIMFGHVDRPVHWARHILHVRRLQERTGGFTEWVPLPFVPMEAPMFLRAKARMGPTWREAVLMHAVGRLALHPLITNIQASWVKLGPHGIAACLDAGVNDLGGTLMEETISRAAGAMHGQEMAPYQFTDIIRDAGRKPRPRTTLYGTPPESRTRASFQAAPLAPSVNTPAKKFERDPEPPARAAGP
ncbi:7,8-didemethyl-8-hydroxy-5-deazariboflavin synthase [Rhodovulum sp. PH10]|uniref:5-amino-6-(D-ribitylamino)uracil--L-tyrosine 4-hydroxyphenyl transferase CofH n=1 Tax=Rhodovulum sp. PH10 TaxID=1187851 RepID=UPI00027C2356|nr:5-amino-6-(D-ribitylamino)uracil--L-tyrosine 4-hydroxyphenyl transferase CofH [Rhodovulum sp. PH10]EJW12352.1 7,8-didemethyl-8-hydroxy-5-deazariboflavin synthase [Rhodovulum sp. PH10]